MNPKNTPIELDHSPDSRRYLKHNLAHVGLTLWGDLDGRCECALLEIFPKGALPVLRGVAAEHGALIITHDRHEELRATLEAATHPGDLLRLHAVLSRADCPVLYGPGGDAVTVPPELISNWDQPEAYWWRRGVDAAIRVSRGNR